jgi:arylsulfatase A-like enzyme/Tfp pilus assembly protein PilF
LSRPFRYTFILVLVAVGTCLAAVSGWRYARASAPVNGPIVLISIEALRADHLSVYGYQGVKTPAIDALAADGVVFERAYSHVPQTLPAHASLLTGRLPFETGVRDGVGFSVPAAERLLPEMLRDRGYATAGVVSSFLLRKETGISQGFAFFDGDTAAADGSPRNLRRGAPESERIAEQWLGSVGSSRSFLFLHLDGFREPDGPADPAAQGAAYDSTIASADEAVGRLVRYLKTHQLYDQATVIVVSDHGEGLGDHGEQGHGLFVYDEALRVPLIIKPPAGEGAGRRVKTVVQHVDLAPTILDLAKAPIPGNLRGQSLTPLLSRDGAIASRPVYSESLYGRYHFGWSQLESLTDGKYRYIRAPREELYDLDVDPRQLSNIADVRPEVVAALRNRLRDVIANGVTAGAMEAVNQEDREAYEALGYVGVAAEPLPPWTELADPKDKWEIVERYRSAVNRMMAQDSKAAIAQLQAMTRTEPVMRDVWLLLGETAARSNRPDVAVDAYRHAMQLAPDTLDAYLGAAKGLVELKKIDEATRLAQRVVDDATADGRSQSAGHELLARIALIHHNPDLALTEATLAEGADASRPVRAYVEGRMAFDRRHYADAFESFESALTRLETTPRQPLADLRLYAAESLLRLERFSEAESLFLEQLKDSPESGRARAGLATVYKATGRASEAAALAHQ